jgi:rod shape-determining protein MreC
VSQSTLRAENERLRELLQIRERESAAFVPASVIRPGTRGSESMFLLDVGTSNGVRVNDPVVVGGGLLGVIREVGPNTSVAMDWTHPDFRVSVMTVDGVGFGIVEPRAGNFREEARLHLVGVPYHTLVPVGAPLVTSGLGSVYPQGILVGWVTELAGTEAGWRRDYWVEPMVRPGSATHVLVFIGEGVLLPSVLQELWLPPGEPEPPLEEEEAAEGLEGAAERLEGVAAAVPELGGGAALPPGDGAPEDPGSPPGSGTLGP